MAIISIIAAVDENSGLGHDNQLLCYLPADLKHFKKITMGKPIIMGRKTFESIGKPLPGRRNIVLSRSPLKIDGVEVVHSLSDALILTKDVPEAMIIGGANIYTQAICYTQIIYLTEIHHQFNADVYFPQLNQEDWITVSSEKRVQDEENPYDMTFHCLERIGVK